MTHEAIIKKAMLKVRAAILDNEPLTAINELVIAFEALEDKVFEREEAK